MTNTHIAGPRDIGEAYICGTFHCGKHGTLKPNGVSASLIAIDFSVQGPKHSRLDFAVIEICYRDESWGSQSGLCASNWFQPHIIAVQKSGKLIHDRWTLSPDVTVAEVGMKIGSVEKTKEWNQDDNCWRLEGMAQPVENMLRKHRWNLYGDDTKLFTVLQEFPLVVVVEHEAKPFTMKVRIRGELAGFWTNCFLYRTHWVPYQTDRFLVDPTKWCCEQELTKEDASEIALEKNKEYLVAQDGRKIAEAIRV